MKKRQIKKNSMEVDEFTYNGFCGSHNRNKKMPYRAKFVRWTSDPGIAVCDCTDGKRRLIPTFALNKFNYKRYYKQPKTGVLFGEACHS